MRTTSLLFLALAGLAAPTARAAGPAHEPQATSTAPPTVSTAGTGEVRVKPDIVVLTIAVVTEGKTAAEAARRNVAQMIPVLGALRRQDLADSAIRTSGYSVDDDDEEYMDRRPAKEAKRYFARNAVRVTLRDLERVGAVVDTALAAGATEVADISYSSTREPALRSEALAAAVRSARADAETIAAAAGGTLGDLVELTTGRWGGAGLYSGAAMRLSEVTVTSTPLLPDDVVVRAAVEMRFLFRPGRP